MGDRDHVATLRELYRLYILSKGGNVQAWLDIMADTIRFRSLGASTPALEFASDCVSRAEVERYFRALRRDWEMVEMQMDEFICQDDRVAVLGSCAWRSRHTGKVAHTIKADFFRFENGLVVEYTELFDTAAAAAAAS